MALDGIDMLRDLADHRGRVAGAGTHLEHAIAGTHLRRFDHQSHDIRLGDGLPLLYGQRGILIGEFSHALGNEALSRHGTHRP